MKIAYASDLHLEHWFTDLEYEPKPYFMNTQGANVLILAGDILLAEALIRFPFFENENNTDSRWEYLSLKFQDFMIHVASQFSHVVFVCGNHEFYGAQYHKVVPALKSSFHAISDNISVLDNSALWIEDVRIIGSTLWTDMCRGSALMMLEAKAYMNDYRAISYNDKGHYRKLDPHDTVGFFNDALEYLKESIYTFENLDCNKQVIVTHHAPSWQSVHPKFIESPLNGAYASELDRFIIGAGAASCPVTHWIHGHMHDPVDYMVGSVNVLSNPLGYPGENLSSYTLKTFET